MNPNVTQLDRLLYDWLAETDDRRFDLAFQRYYAAASSQVIRYLARRSSLPDLDCEQIAVDALLKFFSRVGRDRRQAAQAVGEALPRIQPLNLGMFHVRQVQRWTSEIATFRSTSMSFSAREDDVGRAWKSEIQTLSERILPLQRQGCHLLETARTAAADLAVAFDGVSTADHDFPSDESTLPPEYPLIRKFALGLRDAARTASAEQVAAESRYPGFLGFVEDSWSVVDALPLLRVPTNGYLFDIAQSLYLDECKARGRRKRGGSGYSAPGQSVDGPFDGAANSPHPLAADDADATDEDGEGGESAWRAPAAAEIGIDPTLDQIDEEFCEQFYAYLRKPLEEAEEAYREAATRGRAEAERKRLESITKKNERLMSVLAMRIEGQTQEAIAETLDISRNQVKYIVELVQASYEQFCAAALKTRGR